MWWFGICYRALRLRFEQQPCHQFDKTRLATARADQSHRLHVEIVPATVHRVRGGNFGILGERLVAPVRRLQQRRPRESGRLNFVTHFLHSDTPASMSTLPMWNDTQDAEAKARRQVRRRGRRSRVRCGLAALWFESGQTFLHSSFRSTRSAHSGHGIENHPHQSSSPCPAVMNSSIPLLNEQFR